MSILYRLSSQRRERSEYSNRKAALEARDDPDLLAEIAVGLAGSNAALAGDCAEVMAMVAAEEPELVLPYAGALAALLTHKKARVRWESVHALALLAALTPETIAGALPSLREIIYNDKSVIARDYAVTALGSYAATSPSAARQAYPLLVEALTTWEGKQAAHALNGLANAAQHLPDLHEALCETAEKYARSQRGVVRKAARGLGRVVEG